MVTAQKILVVEDEPDIRKLVQYNLIQERFSVLEAEDGEQALKLLQRETPNLVILDLMLPGLPAWSYASFWSDAVRPPSFRFSCLRQRRVKPTASSGSKWAQTIISPSPSAREKWLRASGHPASLGSGAGHGSRARL